MKKSECWRAKRGLSPCPGECRLECRKIKSECTKKETRAIPLAQVPGRTHPKSA